MTETRLDAVKLDGAGPVYDQIRRAIRDLVVSGEWPPGTSVPPEHALMEQLGASRMTVHRALVQLAREGLIVRRRRSGTGAPVSAPPPIADIIAAVDALDARRTARASGTLVEVVEVASAPVAATASATLTVAATTPVVAASAPSAQLAAAHWSRGRQ